ncbi:Alpha/Beta hydrolase protein [Tribonema minus]|uniref:Alpha/Beta hydrolase protein n=1 Tax=Tribonema minus TaxID=303371 RepID=A0A835ZD24_9STRA|nr:Alpha/Beta hydrolase protein [Tribonema minus]
MANLTRVAQLSLGLLSLRMNGSQAFAGVLQRSGARVGVPSVSPPVADAGIKESPVEHQHSVSADAMHIAKSFQPSEYHPPFWARNNHLHTIAASGDFELRFQGDRSGSGGSSSIGGGSIVTRSGPLYDPISSAAAPAPLSLAPSLGATSELASDFGSASTDGGSALPPTETDLAHIDSALEALADASILQLGGISHSAHDASSSASEATGGAADAAAAAAEAAARGGSRLEQWARGLLEGRGEGGREGAAAGRKLVVLLHGLESSSTQPLTKRIAEAFANRGYDVAAVNFRGCSGELNVKPLGYHLGYTDDLEFILAEVRRRFPGLWDRVYLTGFSLGANVIINFLGQEQGQRAAREHGVAGAAVACAPFNPAASVEMLERTRMGQLLYVPSFVNVLRGKAEAHLRMHPRAIEDVEAAAIPRIRTFSDFNEKLVKPLFGFSSVKEYYEAVDARRHISQVRVPLLVVNARDDPMISAETLPDPQETLPDPQEVSHAPVQLVYHDKGGHCGFLAARRLASGREVKDGRWLPMELTRFVDHVEAHLNGSAAAVTPETASVTPETAAGGFAAQRGAASGGGITGAAAAAGGAASSSSGGADAAGALNGAADAVHADLIGAFALDAEAPEAFAGYAALPPLLWRSSSCMHRSSSRSRGGSGLLTRKDDRGALASCLIAFGGELLAPPDQGKAIRCGRRTTQRSVFPATL